MSNRAYLQEESENSDEDFPLFLVYCLMSGGKPSERARRAVRFRLGAAAAAAAEQQRRRGEEEARRRRRACRTAAGRAKSVRERWRLVASLSSPRNRAER